MGGRTGPETRAPVHAPGFRAKRARRLQGEIARVMTLCMDPIEFLELGSGEYLPAVIKTQQKEVLDDYLMETRRVAHTRYILMERQKTI